MLIRVRARQADRAADQPAAWAFGRIGWRWWRVSIACTQAASPSLDPLSQLLHGDLERVNRLIVERMHSPVGLIPQLAGHIVAGGGKRLRPMLTLGCARLCGYRGDRHIALAAAVEFIHTATLLHDDVVDASDLRRGRDTANAVWGNKPAILVGDFLFSRAFELMVADGSLRILEILSRASAVIAEGEVMQLMTTSDTATTEADYLDVIQAKTAELFAAASRIGAVAGRAPAPRKKTRSTASAAISASRSSWSTTCSTSRRARPSSARASATISATARSPCRSCSPSPAATRRSARSGAARSRRWISSRAISSARSCWSSAAARWPRPWRAPAPMPPPRSRRLAPFRDGPERRALTDAAAFAGDRSF